MVALTTPVVPLNLGHLHAAFLSIVPRIELHASIVFRGVRCPATKADLVTETVAVSWKWFAALAARGKDATRFASALASLAARSVKCGRRLAGKERARDVMSQEARRRHGFTVERLPASFRTAMEDLYGDPQGQRHLDEYEERLVDNTHTPMDEAAAFRIDFPDWLGRQTERDRRIIADMSRDERTLDLSRRFGISPGRVSQLRRQYHQDWNRFHGDGADDQELLAAAAT